MNTLEMTLSLARCVAFRAGPIHLGDVASDLTIPLAEGGINDPRDVGLRKLARTGGR